MVDATDALIAAAMPGSASRRCSLSPASVKPRSNATVTSRVGLRDGLAAANDGAALGAEDGVAVGA